MHPNQQSPVLFQREKFHALSDKYKVITTQDLISRFEAAGYTVRSVQVKRANQSARNGFQGHLVRLQRGDLKFKSVGDVIPEIILKNSYDGTSGVQIMLGIFRLVCSNGLITGSMFSKHSIRHVGSAVDKVLSASQSIEAQLPALEATLHQWQRVELSEPAQIAFERKAFGLIIPAEINASMVDQDRDFSAKRDADTKSDLWTVYNRIQERVLGGGIQYSYVDTDGKIVNNRTRQVKSIDRSTQLNRALFDLAQSYTKESTNA